jgi:hypothetical protein
VQVRSFFLFSVMPMRVVSGKSKLMRVELRTGILRLRALIDGILFWGEEKVLNMREITSANPVVPFEASSSFKPFVYSKREPNV